MENLVFTQLSISEVRQLFRQELESYFANKSASTAGVTQDVDELLTVQKAAEFLTLSVPTVYGLVSKSLLPVCKKGKRLYFSKQELRAWIMAGRKKTISEINTEVEISTSKSRKA